MEIKDLNNILDRNKNYSLIIGTWDPFLNQQGKLFKKFKRQSIKNNLTPLVLIINPSPGFLIHGKYPVYDDYLSKKYYINALGIDCCELIFKKKDLNLGASDFFKFLNNIIIIKEIWISNQQTFGSYEKGDKKAIYTACKQHSISITEFKTSYMIKRKGILTRFHLENGDYQKAVEIVGRKPFRLFNSKTKNHRLDWKLGTCIGSIVNLDNFKLEDLIVKDCSTIDMKLGLMSKSKNTYLYSNNLIGVFIINNFEKLE